MRASMNKINPCINNIEHSQLHFHDSFVDFCFMRFMLGLSNYGINIFLKRTDTSR